MTVFTGITVNLVTVDGGFHPTLALETLSFWILLIISVVWVFLQRSQYVKDRETIRFLDDDFCYAYMREHHLAAIAANLKSNPSNINFKDTKAICKALGIEFGGKS